MHTHPALRLATTGGKSVQPVATKQQVQRILKQYGLRVHEARISSLDSALLAKAAVYVPRKQSSFLVVPVSRSRDLLTGLRRKEVPIRFSTLKTAGIVIDAIFNHRLCDSFVVLYCGEETAVVVSAERFLEAHR